MENHFKHEKHGKFVAQSGIMAGEGLMAEEVGGELSSFSNDLDQLMLVQRNSGVMYWRARDIMPKLGYERWENFANVILKAKSACAESGIPVSQQFRDTTKLVTAGSGASLAVEDVFMTRYACYLVAMNGDPKKAEIAAAQTYFAIQTRKQEALDSLTEEQKRLELRERVIDANTKLNSVAKSAGVQRFDIFHAEGYRGLYGGLAPSEVKQIKGIDPKDDLLDCCGRAELAANEFRITQTEEKLVREKIKGQAPATSVHHQVGTEVRNTIAKIGGTMPEKLPKAPSIKRLIAHRRKQKRLKTTPPKEIAGPEM